VSTFCLCRVTSNIDASAGGNNAVDHPGSSQATYPAPPTKRHYRRSLDSTSTSSAQRVKTKPHGSVSHAVDQNANSMATHGSGVLASRSGAVPESVSGSQEKSRRQLRSEENVQQSGMSDHCHTGDSSMQVLWSGPVAVNGSEICSAELVSRCHIRHTL